MDKNMIKIIDKKGKTLWQGSSFLVAERLIETMPWASYRIIINV